VRTSASFDTANHLHGDIVPALLSTANCTLVAGHHPQQLREARFEYSQGLEEPFTATATPTTLMSSRRLSTDQYLGTGRLGLMNRRISVIALIPSVRVSKCR